MITVAKVVFTSIVIGFSHGGSDTRPLPAPTVTKESIVIEGPDAYRVCRQMETDFHYGMVNYNPDTGRRVSELVEPMDKGRHVSVRRESKCSRVN